MQRDFIVFCKDYKEVVRAPLALSEVKAGYLIDGDEMAGRNQYHITLVNLFERAIGHFGSPASISN